jgi:hypothetical protein
MARKYGSWKTFARRLVAELQTATEITMTVEQIKVATKTTMTVEALQDRGYWTACREGKKYFDAQSKAGLALNEHLDERGKVVAVTYRLATSHAGTSPNREKIDVTPTARIVIAAEVDSGRLGRDGGAVSHFFPAKTSLTNGAHMTTLESGRSFQGFFQSADVLRDNFLARTFGLFSEEIVRIWCRDPNSPYEDLGRPKLALQGSADRGHVLDFALRSRRDGRLYVGEMKCEITFENYRSMTLRSRSQLDRHTKEKEAFRRFLAVARDPSAYQITVNGRAVTAHGAILVWGACTPEGRREVVDGTGILEVLSLEEVISTLIRAKNAEYASFVERQRRRCEELFDFLSPASNS